MCHHGITSLSVFCISAIWILNEFFFGFMARSIIKWTKFFWKLEIFLRFFCSFASRTMNYFRFSAFLVVSFIRFSWKAVAASGTFLFSYFFILYPCFYNVWFEITEYNLIFPCYGCRISKIYTFSGLDKSKRCISWN